MTEVIYAMFVCFWANYSLIIKTNFDIKNHVRVPWPGEKCQFSGIDRKKTKIVKDPH